MTDDSGAVSVSPLHRRDPRKLGGVHIGGRLAATDTGIVYAGQLDGRPVAVAMLSEGAELDSYARARFAQARDSLASSGTPTEPAGASAEGSDSPTVLAGDDDIDIAPWVAVPADTWDAGLAATAALLAPVTLEQMPPVGVPQGPEFRPYWTARRGVGRWRIWPLPWPTSLTSASRWTFVAAFALVLAIAAIALWIAVKLFQNQAPAPPGPGPGPLPLPTPVSPSKSTSPPPSPSGSTPPTTSGGTRRPGPTGMTTAPSIV